MKPKTTIDLSPIINNDFVENFLFEVSMNPNHEFEVMLDLDGPEGEVAYALVRDNTLTDAFNQVLDSVQSQITDHIRDSKYYSHDKADSIEADNNIHELNRWR